MQFVFRQQKKNKSKRSRDKVQWMVPTYGIGIIDHIQKYHSERN